jgi:hypothetical protein
MPALFTPRRLFSTPSVPRQSVPVTSLQRASLEGLEVRDSTWDEWMAAEAAQREKTRAPAPLLQRR